MFLDEATLLFAGDHVLPHITPSIGFEAFTDGHALRRSSPRCTRAATSRRGSSCPATGRCSRTSRGRVDELLAHHDTRARGLRRRR